MNRSDWRMAGLAVTALLLSGDPPIRPSAQWRPGDRILITDFSQVDAVTASPWLVFAATRRGLIIYDRTSRTWRPPVTALEGYPTGRVRLAAWDRGANAVWLDVGGGYVRYDADARIWTAGTPPPEALASVVTVQAALARAPAADALRALILTDPRLRSYQFTAAAATPDRSELFLGTNGMGVVRVDPQTGEWQALPFGLLASGVGAIAMGSGGVWAAATARPGASGATGLTWVASDLSSTRPSEGGGAALGFTFLAPRRLLAAGDALWLASEQGVSRIDPASMRARTFDLGELADVTSLAPAPDGIWVGTLRGLSVITRDNQVVRVGASTLPVLSLVAVRETLWVGTTTGLGVLAPGADAVAPLAELAERPSLRLPVLALARLRSSDTIVMATADQLVWRTGATRRWAALPAPPALGTPTVLAADPEGGVWVGGSQGLAYANLARSFVRVLPAPPDLLAGVRDLAVDGDFLWAATDSGLVRFDRRAARDR